MANEDSREITPGGMKRDPLWWYVAPVLVSVIVAVAGAAYFYFGPSIDDIAGDTARPTARETPVDLAVGDRLFRVPVNYTVFPRDRRDGAREDVQLYGAYPDLDPYGDAPRRIFFDEDPSSDLVRFWVAERRLRVPEARLVDEILKPGLTPLEPPAEAGDLEHYAAAAQPGAITASYAGDDLFVGRTEDGVILLKCERVSDPDAPPAQCRRDALWSGGADFGYAYDRRLLRRWREIDARVRTLLEIFDVGPANAPRVSPDAS